MPIEPGQLRQIGVGSFIAKRTGPAPHARLGRDNLFWPDMFVVLADISIAQYPGSWSPTQRAALIVHRGGLGWIRYNDVGRLLENLLTHETATL